MTAKSVIILKALEPPTHGFSVRQGGFVSTCN